MPLITINKHVADGMWFGPGIEGDVFGGGPVLGDWVCTSRFDQPRDNALGIHAAIDAAPCPWSPPLIAVVAIAGGRVENARRWNGISGPGGSYGNVAILRHDDREGTLSGHLARFSDRIEAWLVAGANAWEAPYIEAGEVIGWMGNTGNVWPVPVNADDHVSGKHLHCELRSTPELGSVLIDPEVRFTFGTVPAPDLPAGTPEEEPPAVEPRPEPNTPLDLTLSAALDEASLARYLAQTMLDHPLPLEDALAALEREAREFVSTFDREGPLLDEARVLAQQIAVMRQAPGAFEYESAIARIRDEFGEQAGVLRLEHEYRLAAS